MRGAARSMPNGSTRGFGYHDPYPFVGERGSGPYLYDVDGNRYVDLVYNGLSLIHGHAYPPVTDALRTAAERGSGWLVASREQIEFAEQLCSRIGAFDLVRFTNSGTEAAMLAVKVARAATGRPAVLKAWGGYHGSYDDLEAGLRGHGELPGRVWLAEYGDTAGFEAVLAEHGSQIAAVVLEPFQYTDVVTDANPEFLRRVEQAAKHAGALFVLDDCLMLRLAPGGSAEKFGLRPDITFLGKFIGGGLPMGVVGGRREVMEVFDQHSPKQIYHGGSFNGNLLACAAGIVSLRDLTETAIADMDRRALRLRRFLEAEAAALDIDFVTAGEGSVFGCYLQSESVTPGQARADGMLMSTYHLAALNNGVLMGPMGEVAMATVLDDEALSLAEEGLAQALRAIVSEPAPITS